MKKGLVIFLWFVSIFLGLLSISFFTAGFLPGTLMLLSAILINPLIVNRLIQMKVLSTGLLIAGLMIASIATLSNPGVGVVSAGGSSEGVVISRSIGEDTSPISTPFYARDEKITESSLAGLAAAMIPAAKNDPTATNEYPRTPLAKTVHPVTTQTSVSRSLADEYVRSAEIEIVSYTTTVSRGDYASIKIKGEPDTNYTCDVKYKTQMSTAKGLGVKKSDDEGYVAWEWKVGTNTSLDYRLTIMIKGGGDDASVQFRVVD